MTILPINPGGMGDPGRTHVQSQMAQSIAERREALKAAEALDGDARVLRYCSDILAQNAAPLSGQITINGEPLNRDRYAQPIPPGYPR